MAKGQSDITQRKKSASPSSAEYKKKGFKEFMYDKDEGTFFGRTGSSWAKILTFYFCFYTLLIGFWALNLYCFSKTLLDNEPTFKLDKSLIGTNPGVGFLPFDPNAEDPSITYKSGDDKDAMMWYNQLDQFIKDSQVPPADSKDVVNCNSAGPHANNGTVCKVDVANLGRCTAANKFGYLDGKPCFIVKLNRIYGWEPQPFGINGDGKYDANLLKTQLDDKSKETPPMPETLKNYILERVKSSPGKEADVLKTVWVSCVGASEADQKHIPSGTITYLPQPGIPTYYFPFMNQQNYRSPFVMVAIDLPQTSRHAKIGIQCQAWAKNIMYQKFSSSGLGFVKFQLTVN